MAWGMDSHLDQETPSPSGPALLLSLFLWPLTCVSGKGAEGNTLTPHDLSAYSLGSLKETELSEGELRHAIISPFKKPATKLYTKCFPPSGSIPE